MRNHENENAVTLPLIVQQDTVLVDARLLHSKLQVKSKFADWIKAKIADYGFTNSLDFFQNFRKSTFGRNSVEYHLSLDMAKELAMLERNEIGRQVRRYFIAKEKEVRGVAKALPAVKHLFSGLDSQKINGRKLYPYKEYLAKIGMNTHSGAMSTRVLRYQQHFVKFGKLLYITEEFASHLYHQRAVYLNRTTMKNSQPVLPLDFGQQDLFLKGGLQ